jgi:hypothetical protein
MIPTSGKKRIPPKRDAKVTGSCRKTPKSDGTWKQYFAHEKKIKKTAVLHDLWKRGFSRFSPVTVG